MAIEISRQSWTQKKETSDKAVKVFNVEMKRAFLNRRWLIIFFLPIAVYLLGRYRWFPLTVMDDTAPHPVNRLMLVMGYGNFDLVAPLLATLPFADSFVGDFGAGFARMVVQRVTYRRYVWAKALATTLSGGAALVLALLILFLIGLNQGVRFDPGPYSTGMINTDQPGGPFSQLYMTQPLAYLPYLMACAFAFGGMYAFLGLAVSTMIPNRYVALLLPLVLIQAVYFGVNWASLPLEGLDPLLLLFPFMSYGDHVLLSQGLQVMLVILFSLLTYAAGTRRNRWRI